MNENIGTQAKGQELPVLEWKSVIDEPANNALARFFDNDLGEWVYTVFREGPVRCTSSAPYTEWLSLDVFNRPIYLAMTSEAE